MAGPGFIEIGSDDPAATAASSAAVFGRGIGSAGEGGGMVRAEGRPVGLYGGDVPRVALHLPVPDLDAAIAPVRAAGGSLMGAIAGEGAGGRFATCREPRGARFGLNRRG